MMWRGSRITGAACWLLYWLWLGSALAFGQASTSARLPESAPSSVAGPSPELVAEIVAARAKYPELRPLFARIGEAWTAESASYEKQLIEARLASKNLTALWQTVPGITDRLETSAMRYEATWTDLLTKAANDTAVAKKEAADARALYWIVGAVGVVFGILADEGVRGIIAGLRPP
jgi:hypothetical protein